MNDYVIVSSDGGSVAGGEDGSDIRHSWEDEPSFELPALFSKEIGDRENMLLLAWILFLYRLGGSSNGERFQWGMYELVNGRSVAVTVIDAALSEVIFEDTKRISQILEAIRTLSRQPRSSINDDCVSQDEHMFFSSNGPIEGQTSESSSDVQIEARSSNGRLKIRPAPSRPQSIASNHILTYIDILHLILSSPNQTIPQALQFGTHELAQLWAWNTPIPPTISECMHTIISARAQNSPERPAVLSWDGSLTYGELDLLSTRLAIHLIKLGIGIGKIVPFVFEKSVWTVVGVLAVMKAGAGFVLTDPQQPEARLKIIVEEVSAEVILTSVKQAELGPRIAPAARTVVVGPALREQIDGAIAVDLPSIPGSSVLYVIFTSGSTGKPKGVVISHTNYTSGALPRAEAVGYKAHSRVLDFASYAFDVSIDCMLCTLSQGGCICVPSDEQRINDLSGAIRDLQVNMAHMTPSVARVLASDILPSLEVLGLGGESLSSGDAAAWGQHTKVVIAYGPSECTVGCTINNDIPVRRSYTSIGKGVGGVTWIVDPDDHEILTPIGGVGELLIEGPIVGIGYINEPEKTAAVFIDDPAWLIAGNGKEPGRRARLYKTGDLVKYDPDGSGSIVFVGRKDRQVKLRGQRVELAEIEYHLQKQLPSGISVAVEVITPGGKGKGREPTLVAFIAENIKARDSTDKNNTIAFSKPLRACLSDIDTILSASLPIYMIPTAYIPLFTLPLLLSCKTDRKQLQEIGTAMSYQQLARFRAEVVEKHKPATDMEHRLHTLWVLLFGNDMEIGVQDNFFALGGDSLRAMKLVAAARGVGVALTVAGIFTFPKLSDLALNASLISADAEADIPPFSLLNADWEEANARSEAAGLCDLEKEVVEDVYPCTPLQEGLMALSAKISESYIAQRIVDLSDLDKADRLRAAFEAVAMDCPILRTRVVQIPGRGLMQVVVNEPLSWFSSHNLEEYLLYDREKSMGLGEPLSRFAIVTDEKTAKVYLVLTIHHTLYDGWSMPLIIERVNQAYRGLKLEPRTPFKAFIKYLSSSNRANSETYWKQQLQGATGPQFPSWPYSGYQVQTDSLLESYTTFDEPPSSSTTVATAIRGAWALVASKYIGSKDIVFGETLTGRNAPVPGIEQIEGPIITTVPVRICVNRQTRIADFLQYVHTQTLNRIPHEHMGLQHIRRLSPDSREACELKTGLVLHPNTEEGMAQDGEYDDPASGFVPAGDEDAAREALKFSSYALMLVCSLGPKGFLTMASFDSKTVDRVLMERVLEELGRTVQFLCGDTAGTIGDLHFLSEKDRVELWRLSSSGPRNLAQLDKILAFSDATATWIVDPEDSEHLLPMGAIGELLVERPEETLGSAIDGPRWLFEGCTESPGRETPIHKTGQLARYQSDGSLLLITRRDGVVKPQAEIESHSVESRPQTPSPIEQDLLRLWSHVLGIPENEISLADSFFELGGDSIGAMKLVSESRMEGLELTVAQIFLTKRLCDMAKVVKSSKRSTTESAPKVYAPFSALDITDVSSFVSENIIPALAQPTWRVKDVLPTRPLQEIAVRGTVQLPRFSARYELFYLDARIDREKLFKSCQELISRNEILRTVFVNNAGICYGVVLEHLVLPVVEYEIEGDIGMFSQKLCDLDVQTKMPLGSAFVKFMFVQGEDGRGCLIFRISHAQYDEICLPSLLRQLSALYEDRPVPTVIPFSTFVHHVVRKEIPKCIAYWRDLLQGSSMTVLRPDIELSTRKAGYITRTFDISGRSKDTTVATLPTAAWALCLARTLSIRDVTFGEVVSGRNIDFANCDTVMGPCWQYVPFRVMFDEKWTGQDLLHFVQNQHINSTPYEGIGLKEVIENCTDWASDVQWFDSVVHQDVEHVENLAFLSANGSMETIYPHPEPLREWKIQAFPKGNNLSFEIVTYEPWLEFAEQVLENFDTALQQLVNRPQVGLFESVGINLGCT